MIKRETKLTKKTIESGEKSVRQRRGAGGNVSDRLAERERQAGREIDSDRGRDRRAV